MVPQQRHPFYDQQELVPYLTPSFWPQKCHYGALFSVTILPTYRVNHPVVDRECKCVRSVPVSAGRVRKGRCSTCECAIINFIRSKIDMDNLLS